MFDFKTKQRFLLTNMKYKNYFYYDCLRWFGKRGGYFLWEFIFVITIKKYNVAIKATCTASGCNNIGHINYWIPIF